MGKTLRELTRSAAVLNGTSVHSSVVDKPKRDPFAIACGWRFGTHDGSVGARISDIFYGEEKDCVAIRLSISRERRPRFGKKGGFTKNGKRIAEKKKGNRVERKTGGARRPKGSSIMRERLRGIATGDRTTSSLKKGAREYIPGENETDMGTDERPASSSGRAG